MTPFDALILGIVEGLTEFLPVSSTGHLILTSALLHIPTTEFLKSFEIIIQLGAILAVVVLYFKKLFKFELIQKLVVAFLPTAVIGLVFYKAVKTYLLGDVWMVITMLILGGVIFIIFEQTTPDSEHHHISYKNAFLIGLAQAVAIIPGVSRSAATILGGRALGISRAAIVEFSFLLAVPTMVAATGLDLIKSDFAFTNSEWLTLALGLVVSFVVALFAVRWFLKYIQTNSFSNFGYYRIGIALLFVAYFIT